MCLRALIMVLLGSGLALQASESAAQVQAEVVPSSTSVQPGDTFALEVHWSGNPGLGHAEYFVVLNAGSLTLTGIEFDDGTTTDGGFSFAASIPDQSELPLVIDSQAYALHPGRNDLLVDWTTAGSGQQPLLGNDLTLSFEATGVSVGQTITVDLDIWQAEDVEGNTLDAQAVGSSIQVVPEPGSLAVLLGGSLLALRRPRRAYVHG